jgi:hypothetical protein
MTAKVLAKATVGEASLTKKVEMEEWDAIAHQDGRGLESSQNAHAMQGCKPEKRQLQL